MNERISIPLAGRRAFLRAALPGGALLCLGGRCLVGAPQAKRQTAGAVAKHKFLTDSGMSFAEVFRMAYGSSLSLWRGFEKELGKEKFAALMKQIVDEAALRESAEMARKAGKNDLAAYMEPMKNPDRFWSNVLTFRAVEDTPKAYEVRVTECLWAKTFHDANAADLGYLLSCYGDYASAKGFNPKMRLIRTKTLMQGDAFCNHRYVVEG